MKDIAPFPIGARQVEWGHPCFLIAEAGGNHNGDVGMARRLIDAAKEAGADAVKFQTFSAERLVTADAPQAAYQIRNLGVAEGQYAMLKRLELSEDAHRELLQHCEARGILFLSTPFEEESADFLESLGVTAYKIPSSEITNTPFLAHVACKGKPLIVSTGMSTMEEVHEAVAVIRQSGNPPLALLHCVSNYPAAPEDINLRAMATLREAFGVPVGYSDHTQGLEIALAAVALGACIIEKHFTLDRALPGPDHKASLEPTELQNLVTAIRRVEASFGDGNKRPMAGELVNKPLMQKSLVTRRFVPAGKVFEPADLACRRPATGLPPAWFARIVGRTAARDVPENTPLTLADIEGHA